MNNRCIVLHEQRCINCRACEIHCQVWKNLPASIKLGRILHTAPHMTEQGPGMRTAYLTCMHCDPAPCIKACPSRSMRRRDDGIVYIDEGTCLKCKGCIMACPWRIPQVWEESGHVVKCDLCRARLDQGLKPEIGRAHD